MDFTGACPKNRMPSISSLVENLHFLRPPCDRARQKESIDGSLGPNSIMDHRWWPWTRCSHGCQSAKFKIYNWPHRRYKAPKGKKRLWDASVSTHARIERHSQRSDSDVDQTSLGEMTHTELSSEFWLQTPQRVSKLHLYCKTITKLEIWRHLDALLSILFFRAFLIFRAPTDWILRIT